MAASFLLEKLLMLRCAIVAGLCFMSQLSLADTNAMPPNITIEQDADVATVKIDGELFTKYITKSKTKPILWPIIGPTGKAMTRSYPMADVEGEAKDHPHQRSMWFTHGDVNGVSFWDEGPKAGSIIHREFKLVRSEPTATIVTVNDWIDVQGNKICEDERTLVFSSDGRSRAIDFTVVVKASKGDLTFGQTKEGAFGIRVAEAIKAQNPGSGTIVNSNGQRGDDAWGQPAAWVDYFGQLDGETVGIAILNHPSSFRFPTHWHVRSYGLFAANPFGLKDFGKEGEGAHTIASGDQMTLRYRVIFHEGDEKAADIAKEFEKYSK